MPSTTSTPHIIEVAEEEDKREKLSALASAIQSVVLIYIFKKIN
jgi:hypothetical protein